MSFPLVSICIPVYNAEKYVSETLESAVNQTYKNIEIIIVDDGSFDRSWEIIEGYRNRYPLIIKTFKQENKGGCAARNKAFLESKGEFIQWLDADDILSATKIEVQLNYLLKYNDPYIIHSSAYGIFYHNIKRAKFNENFLFNDMIPEKWLYYHLKYGHYMFPAVWMVSRDLINLAGHWNEELTNNQDGEFFSRLVSKSKFVKFHGESICYYRKGTYSSISRSLGKNKKSLLSLHKSVNLICDYLLSLSNSYDSKEACINALSRLCHIIKDSLPEYYRLNIVRINSLGGQLKPEIQSTKYKLFKKVFGESSAKKIKSLLWYLEVMYNEKKEFFQSKFNRGGDY